MIPTAPWRRYLPCLAARLGFDVIETLLDIYTGTAQLLDTIRRVYTDVLIVNSVDDVDLDTVMRRCEVITPTASYLRSTREALGPL